MHGTKALAKATQRRDWDHVLEVTLMLAQQYT